MRLGLGGVFLSGLALFSVVSPVMGDVTVHPVEVFQLPPNHTKPSAMILGDNGDIYLTLRSSVEGEETSKLVSISPSGAMFALHTFGKIGSKEVPVLASGMAFGSDGLLYVADTVLVDRTKLGRKGKNKKSSKKTGSHNRVIRVNLDNGIPHGEDVVVILDRVQNVTLLDDFMYVSGANHNPFEAGVFKFPLSEMRKGNLPDRLNTRGLTGKELLKGEEFDSFFSREKDQSTNTVYSGVGRDSKGNLYVGIYEPAEIWKLTVSETGSLEGKHLLLSGEQHGVLSVEGLSVDHEDNLWVTDPLGNALVWVDTAVGNVKIVAKNTAGSGLLKQPKDCVRRENKIYVANQNSSDSDESHTIPVFEIQ